MYSMVVTLPTSQPEMSLLKLELVASRNVSIMLVTPLTSQSPIGGRLFGLPAV